MSVPVSLSPRVRAGLILCIVLGVLNVAFLFVPTGGDGPPLVVNILGLALGLGSVAGAVIFWRTGSRPALRLAAGTLIINGVAGLPAFFVDIDAWVKVATAIATLATVAAVVLMLSREPGGAALAVE